MSERGTLAREAVAVASAQSRIGRLCISDIPEDFDPEHDIVLDPSCFVGKEASWPNWHTLKFNDEYQDPDELWSDWMKVRRLANWYARELGRDLNLRHGTAYGGAYWRELLILWLLLLIQAVWVRERALVRLIREYGDRPFRFEVPTITQWDFLDDLDFMDRGIRNPVFHGWIVGHLLEGRLPPNWQLVARPGTTVAPEPSLPRFPRWRPRVDSIPGMGRAFSIAASLILNLRPAEDRQKLYSEDHIPVTVEGVLSVDFRRKLNLLISATMPRTLTDRYRTFDDEARRFRFRAGKASVVASTKYRAENRFLFAHAKQAGERLYRVQHGSGYGMARAMNAQEIEYFDSGFISWGWRRDGLIPADAIPLPAPMLSRLPKWRGVNEDVLLIGTNVELSAHPFKAAPQPGQWLAYLECKCAFVRALPPRVQAKFIYRPRMGVRNDLNDVDALIREFGPITILKGDLAPALARSRIAVIDHPGTAIHVMMAMGVPTVMFWQRDAWIQHPEADAAFDMLRAAKILFHDPAAAATHVATVHAAPQSWWNSADVRAARTQWNALYALADRKWRRKWLTWLLKA